MQYPCTHASVWWCTAIVTFSKVAVTIVVRKLVGTERGKLFDAMV